MVCARRLMPLNAEVGTMALNLWLRRSFLVVAAALLMTGLLTGYSSIQGAMRMPQYGLPRQKQP